MALAPLHTDEKARIEVLKSYHIDPSKQKDFDELTELACKLTDVPKSLISIVDKDEVWFKSQHGLQLNSSPRELSFCSHAINSNQEVFLIEDTRKEPEFADHPFVKAADPLIFYAGVPLKDGNGLPYGTICVLDNVPHKFTDEQRKNLLMVADLAQRQFELKRANLKLKEKARQLQENNKMLENFAHTVSHDLKMPLANIIMTSDMLKASLNGKLNDKDSQYLSGMKEAAFSMSDYIENILNHYESEQLIINTQDEIDIYSLLEDIEDMIGQREDFNFKMPENNLQLKCDSSALRQILLNLIGNSIKYNDKDLIEVRVETKETPKFYWISVEDNGVGIPDDKKDKIFELFTTLNTADRAGKKGHGIGLSTVKILVDKMGGVIKCRSKVNEGTTFTFSIKK